MGRGDVDNRGSLTVAHLTSAHPAFDARIFGKECRSLAAAGHDVKLIACHGRDEVRDGVEICSIARPRGRLERMLVTPFRVARRALKSGAGVCHIHDPELIPVAFFLKACGRKIVYDVHEDLPRDVMAKPWLPAVVRPVVAAAAGAMERLAAVVFDGIVAATPDIAARFPARKTVLVQNFAIADELAVESPVAYAERSNMIAYVGGVSVERGAFGMVDAIAAVDPSLDARLELAGPMPVPGFAKQLEAREGWERVTYRGVLDRVGVSETLARSRAGLVLLHPTEAYLRSYPVKMFEYMAAGLPVIASDFPLWREIVEETGSGLVVDPMSPEKIAEAIAWVLTNEREAEAMGKRGRQAVLDTYNWGREEAKLLTFYERFGGQARRPLSVSNVRQ